MLSYLAWSYIKTVCIWSHEFLPPVPQRTVSPLPSQTRPYVTVHMCPQTLVSVHINYGYWLAF